MYPLPSRSREFVTLRLNNKMFTSDTLCICYRSFTHPVHDTNWIVHLPTYWGRSNLSHPLFIHHLHVILHAPYSSKDAFRDPIYGWHPRNLQTYIHLLLVVVGNFKFTTIYVFKNISWVSCFVQIIIIVKLLGSNITHSRSNHTIDKVSTFLLIQKHPN